MKKFFIFFCMIFSISCLNAELKVLHLSMHKGLIKEFEGVAKELSLDLTSLYLHDMPPNTFDPAASNSNALYNVGHERAERIWNKHKDAFNSYDVIVVSDTAPLCRIFLQNGFKKPLIVWVCNRFDYFDKQNLDCSFPDPEYYDLIKGAKQQKNVLFITYNPFENHYAKSQGIDLGQLVIKPCAACVEKRAGSSMPQDVDKKTTFFLPRRHNETTFMDLSKQLNAIGIKNYCGNYNNPSDIADFKGVIHLPYAWSNLALFENLQLGLPYFVPSEKFMRELLKSRKYWFSNSDYLLKDDAFSLTEWYCDDVKDVLVYFDSWNDLLIKTKTMDYGALTARTKAFALRHKTANLERWKKAFKDIQKASK